MRQRRQLDLSTVPTRDLKRELRGKLDYAENDTVLLMAEIARLDAEIGGGS